MTRTEWDAWQGRFEDLAEALNLHTANGWDIYEVQIGDYCRVILMRPLVPSK